MSLTMRGYFLAIMHGHISTLAIVIAIGEELTHEVLEGKSTLLINTSLAILGERHIIWGQSCRGADRDALFTLRNL